MTEQEMQAIIAQLVKEGKMPTLEQYLEACKKVGEEMRPEIEALRKSKKEHSG